MAMIHFAANVTDSFSDFPDGGVAYKGKMYCTIRNRSTTYAVYYTGMSVSPSTIYDCIKLPPGETSFIVTNNELLLIRCATGENADVDILGTYG